MFLVSDVHGAYRALAEVAASGERVLVLGDLVNLIDYRTHSGVLADIVGADVVRDIIALRDLDPDASRKAWQDAEAKQGVDLRSAIADRIEASYREFATALSDVDDPDVLVIHGNVDDPRSLRRHLPRGVRWVQGTTVRIGTEVFGFAGGGVPRIGTPGEIDDEAMERTLEELGPVDVLCTHVPPALPMVSDDVIGGLGKGSRPVLEYLDRYGPRLHYFGDVHQARAVRMRHGETECVNVGYFRATHRAVRHTTDGVPRS